MNPRTTVTARPCDIPGCGNHPTHLYSQSLPSSTDRARYVRLCGEHRRSRIALGYELTLRRSVRGGSY